MSAGAALLRLAPGDALGAWTVVEALPSDEGARRWRVQGSDGALADALTLWPPGAADATDVARFARVHRERVERPAGQLPGRELIHVDGWPVAIREATHAMRVRDLALPLPAREVAALGLALVPAILELAPEAGHLLPDDVAITLEGGVALAPLVRPSRAQLSATRDFAPEEPPGPAAALFSLGALLFWLSTGRTPLHGRGGLSGPPPSTFRAHVPPEFDRAVQALLSGNPAERVQALPWLQAAAGPPPDLRLAARRGTSEGIMSPGRLVLSTSASPQAPSRSRPSTPSAFLQVPPARLGALDGDERATVVARAQLPLSALLDAERAGRPLILAATGSGASKPDTTALETLGAAEWVRPAGWLMPLAATLTLAGSAVFGLVGAFLHPALVLLAVGSAALPAALLASWFGRSRRFALARAAWEAQQRGDASSPAYTRAIERISALRLQIASSELSAPARSDLRAALQEVEVQLGELEAAQRRAASTLEAADLDAARARLVTASAQSAADADARALRDRLATSVAELEAVAAQRTALEREMLDLHGALDELGATLSRGGRSASSSDVVAALRRANALARESVEPGPPSRSKALE